MNLIVYAYLQCVLILFVFCCYLSVTFYTYKKQICLLISLISGNFLDWENVSVNSSKNSLIGWWPIVKLNRL